jgi:hypothetical protein
MRVATAPNGVLLFIGFLVATFAPSSGAAAQTPAAPVAKPDDTPSIRLGVTVFADYTITCTPRRRVP